MIFRSMSNLPWLILIALATDRWLGEPPTRWHPVVWMGRWLGLFSTGLPRLPAASAFVAGAAAWGIGAALVVGVAVGVERWLLSTWPAWVAVPLLGLLLKPLLAWRMLRDEVQAVDTALAESLAQGRIQLSRLVSRDTTALSATDVREAAIETLAENLNDSVIAPLFWLAVAGLPGAALYRFANTADAMWGYRGRWEWAGKWAAWVDDGLSWLPARLTALLLCAAAGRWPGWATLCEQASRTPSPNGGWPMGAMAWLLGCRLSKPGVYVLNENGRAPQAGDHRHALHGAGRAVGWVAGGAVLGVLAGWM